MWSCCVGRVVAHFLPSGTGVRKMPSSGLHAAARSGAHPVTVTIDAGHLGPVVGGDFAGLSFERGPLLSPGNAGVSGNLFSPDNNSLITLFRNLGLGSLRIGGGTVDQLIPAGTGSDGLTGIDNLFAFAAAAGVKVIYSLRLLSPAANPMGDLKAVHAQAAGHIWGRYQQNVASFAIGNEPDWHAYHSHPGHPLDPAIFEQVPGVPGSAYPSWLAQWRSLAGAVAGVAPGAPLSGPDLGAYSRKTYTPDPDSGVSWTEQLARDERDAGRLAEVTQHYYVGDSPGRTTAQQAISNMLSPEWVNGTAPGTQPTATTYTPYRWLYENNLAPVAAAGLRFRLTESNDYLVGVPGASDAFASALWALDHLHWWAAHGAAGVNFHNRRGLCTATIVPNPAGRWGARDQSEGIRHQSVHPRLGGAGQARPSPEPGRHQRDRLLRRRSGRGLRHGHQQGTRRGRWGCRRHDHPARPKGAGRGGDDPGRRAAGRRPGGQGHARRRHDHRRHPLGRHMERPAHRSARGHQPDHQGHHRRRHQDP